MSRDVSSLLEAAAKWIKRGGRKRRGLFEIRVLRVCVVVWTEIDLATSSTPDVTRIEGVGGVERAASFCRGVERKLRSGGWNASASGF